MKKIDWYIFKQLIIVFVFVVGLLEIIICVIDYTDKNDNFIKHELSAALIWRYYSTVIPFMASLLTPITVFIATVFVNARLASRTEIIAMMAGGISLARIMLPYFLCAVLIGSASFYLNGYVLPDANKFRLNFEEKYTRSPFTFAGSQIHLKIGQKLYLYINRYNGIKNEGYNVTLEVIDQHKLIEKIHAIRILWDSSGVWHLIDWQKRTLSDSSEIITEGKQLDTVLNLTPADFTKKHNFQETMTLKELDEYIKLQESRGADDVHIYQLEKYVRYMLPFAVIILMAIGVIVSYRKSRQGMGIQITLGFSIAFLYIIAYTLAQAIAESGVFNPFLAIWLPNISFSLLAIILYKLLLR